MKQIKCLWFLAWSGFSSAAHLHSFRTEQQVVVKSAPEHGNSMLDVRSELRKAEIIPTVLDDFIPPMTLTIAWPWQRTSKYNITSKLGNTLDPDLLGRSPNVYINSASMCSNPSSGEKKKESPEFVLTMTDPDAPSRDDPKWSEMCHWIVAARGSKHVKQLVKYQPPGPPPRTGKHRYVFTAWIAANQTSAELHLKEPDGRRRWGYGEDERDAGRVGVRRWAEENGLMPVAANFIYAQNKKQ